MECSRRVETEDHRKHNAIDQRICEGGSRIVSRKRIEDGGDPSSRVAAVLKVSAWFLESPRSRPKWEAEFRRSPTLRGSWR